MQYTKSATQAKTNRKEVSFTKRIFSAVLALILAFSVITSVDCTTVFATTNGKTQADAVNWIKDQGNSSFWKDVDGVYGCQCVDLILAYYDYLVGYHTSGNAYQYASNALPSGWYRDYNPTPGSIIVWAANSYAGNNWSTGWTGHIGLVYAVSGSNVYTVETNLVPPYDGAYGVANAQFKTRNPQNVIYIHPDFAEEKFTFDVNTILDGVINNCGISGLTFDVYINGSKQANDVIDFCNSFPKGTTYRVDDIKTSGALIYSGNSSFSGTINGTTEVKLPVKTGLTIKSKSDGLYKVTIPANFKLGLYGSATEETAKYSKSAQSTSYVILCKDRYELSDGTVRYGYCFSSQDYRCFTFTSKMKAEKLTLDKVRTISYKVTIPSGYELHLYTSATASYTEYYIEAKDSAYVCNCNKMYVFSDGSVRFRYLSGEKEYFFDYSSSMSIDCGCSYGHTYTTDSTKLAKAATCNSPAYYYKRCSKCGEYSSDTFTKGEALGHTYAAKTVAPTCTSSGYKVYTCSRCSDSYIAYTESATGHKAVKDAAVEATCTHTGKTEGSHCSECNAVITPQETIPMVDHTDNNADGKCDFCGKAMQSSSSSDTTSEDTNSNTDQTSCNCACHDENGQMSSIWKILIHICKILGINKFKYCECGKSHY